MKPTQHLLHNCLYFTANSLSRVISRMADEEFMPAGLSPSHAFLLMVVFDTPGITQRELAGQLQLAPSTITRFIDNLAYRGLLLREIDGKNSRITCTLAGYNLQPQLQAAWKNLYNRYSRVLGIDKGHSLTSLLDETSKNLQNG